MFRSHSGDVEKAGDPNGHNSSSHALTANKITCLPTHPLQLYHIDCIASQNHKNVPVLLSSATRPPVRVTKSNASASEERIEAVQIKSNEFTMKSRRRSAARRIKAVNSEATPPPVPPWCQWWVLGFWIRWCDGEEGMGKSHYETSKKVLYHVRGRMGGGDTNKVGIPTLPAAETPTVDLHVLRDGATTLLASWCEAPRHNSSRLLFTRTE